MRDKIATPVIKRLSVVAGLIVTLTLAISAPAYAVITDAQTPNNWAGVRYDSSVDTLTLWDNTPGGDEYASAVVNNVTTGRTKTFTHYWTSSSPSKRFPLGSGFSSGNEIRFYVCSRSGFDGSVFECSPTRTAWV